jgi:hypothetical protein
MAWGDNVQGTWTVEDAKGKKSSFGVNFPAAVDVPLVTGDFMRTTAQLLDEIVDGRITDASASIGVNLDGVTLKDAPISGSDVEESAIFSFRSTAGAPTIIRLPTIDETFGLETGEAVDLSAPDVNSFVQRVLEGDTQGLTTVRFSDAHGNNVSGLKRAEERFRKSRRKR